jgi:hypothetical protein
MMLSISSFGEMSVKSKNFGKRRQDGGGVEAFSIRPHE